jgi:hypothetical protein
VFLRYKPFLCSLLSSLVAHAAPLVFLKHTCFLRNGQRGASSRRAHGGRNPAGVEEKSSV